MNENVKEKRYYCDVMLSHRDFTKTENFIYFFVPFIVGLIVSLTYYSINLDKFKYEFNSYSEEKLERIQAIRDIFITEGSRFDLSYIPEDVSFNVEYNGNEIKFHILLDDDSELKFAPSLYMDITLSSDLRILDESTSYTCKEEYINATKSSTYIFVFLAIFIVTVAIMFVVEIIGMLIGMFISCIHKKIDLSQKSKKETEG